MMYLSASYTTNSEDTVLGRINDDYLESEHISSLFSNSYGQFQVHSSDYPSNSFSESGRLDPSMPAA